jgi:hypothetical protein
MRGVIYSMGVSLVERAMRPARLAASLTLCTTALAACGSSHTQPTSSGSVYTQALQYADCMRANGVSNFPDPSSNGASGPLSGLNQTSTAFRTAATACATKVPPSVHLGPPAPTAAQMRAALAFSHCMRAHGLSQFPDPWTTAPGDRLYLDVGPGEYFPAIGEVQMPVFRHAAKACGLQL